jgi:CheY-like chemotaxis protein
MTNLGKVLLVDDDATSNYISTHMLRLTHAAAQITVANNGREALELVREASFDLVLLDVNMPVMGGFQFLESLRQLQETTGMAAPAVAVLTSSISDFDKDRVSQYPMVKGYLTKPLRKVHVNELATWLSEAIDKPEQPLYT